VYRCICIIYIIYVFISVYIDGDIIQFGGGIGNYVDGKKRKTQDKHRKERDREDALTACIEYRYMCAYPIEIPAETPVSVRLSSPSPTKLNTKTKLLSTPTSSTGSGSGTGSAQLRRKRQESELLDSESKRFKHYLKHAAESEAEFDVDSNKNNNKNNANSKITDGLSLSDTNSITNSNSNSSAIDMKLILNKLVRIEEMVKLEPGSGSSAADAHLPPNGHSSDVPPNTNSNTSTPATSTSTVASVSAMVVQHLNDIQTRLTCALCQHTLTRPCVLLCSHSFCQHCIEAYYNTQPPSLCPLCHCSIEMVRSSSYDIYYNRNTILDEVIEQFRQLKHTCGGGDNNNSDNNNSTNLESISTGVLQGIVDSRNNTNNTNNIDSNNYDDVDRHPFHTLDLSVLTNMNTGSIGDGTDDNGTDGILYIDTGGDGNECVDAKDTGTDGTTKNSYATNYNHGYNANTQVPVLLDNSSSLGNSNNNNNNNSTSNPSLPVSSSLSLSLASTLFDSAEEPDY